MGPHERSWILDRFATVRAAVGRPLPVCGFYHPADQALVLELEKRGLLRAWRGEGKDAGLLLAQEVRAPFPVMAADAGAPAGGEGAA